MATIDARTRLNVRYTRTACLVSLYFFDRPMSKWSTAIKRSGILTSRTRNRRNFNTINLYYKMITSACIRKILYLATLGDIHTHTHTHTHTHIYTGCPRRKGPNFGRVFLRSNYTDITQNTYIQSSMVTEILAREV